MPEFGVDEHGMPMLFADVPDSGITRVDHDTPSGNKRHDARSGRFGSGGGGPKKATPPANVDPNEYKRRLDAVRDAAREMEEMDTGDIAEFLAGRTKRQLQPDEIEEFLRDVKEQRITDTVDLLDKDLRGKSDLLKRGRRVVRLQAPRGFTKRVLSSLSEEQLADVHARLMARGHSEEAVEEYLNRSQHDNESVKEKSRAKLSDDPAEGVEGVAASYADDAWEPHNVVEDPRYPEEFRQALKNLGVLAGNIRVPDVHVEVPVTVENKPTRKVVKRNDQGFIEEVVEEQDA